MSIANDTKSLASYLPALRADLVPRASVKLIAAITQLSCKDNDLSDDEFGDGAGVREGGVEHADSVACSIFEIYLVRAYAEAADDDQVAGFRENACCQLRFRADAEDMDISTMGSVYAIPGAVFDLPYLLNELVLR